LRQTISNPENAEKFRAKYAAPGTDDVADAEVIDVEPEPAAEGQPSLVDLTDPDLTAAAEATAERFRR
jgi:hypothetical protein